MPDKPEFISCGFLVARRNPQIQLLIMEHKDRLDLPKGHVDPGESFLQCARREFEEETGIDSARLTIEPEFEFVTRYQVASKRTAHRPALKELRIYLAWLPAEELPIRPTEHLGFRWLPWVPGQALQTETIDPLFRYLDRFWEQNPPDRET